MSSAIDSNADRQYRHHEDGQATHQDVSRLDTEPKTPKSVLLLYLALFSILGHQLSNATKVHSRFGLAFTGCVQLCCSAVMSFSVLALLGWNGWGWNTGVETSLPTYVLPFVIVVVGAENMSTLVRSLFCLFPSGQLIARPKPSSLYRSRIPCRFESV